MKTVRDSCQLQDNALNIRVSEQIEDLDQLIGSEGDGREFFERTFITQGMHTLIEEGFARLAGKSSQAVFHLKQSMGGGKTHLLVGFGLLAKHPSLRTQFCSDVRHGQNFQSAKVAAFNGRNTPKHFFWGEIAHQLGRPEEFKGFWAKGPEAPDERDWLRLFESDEPIVVLLDELPPYFQILATQQIGNGTVADISTRAFANMLSAARKKANVCVIVSDLAASYSTGTHLIQKALSDARDELGRQERNITPVDLAGNEIYDILRKCLFKSLPDLSAIQEIAATYAKLLSEACKAKAVSRSSASIADEIVTSYPFHPRLKNLIALFKENEKFKQTRGLMELISRLLKSVWKSKSNDVFLIGPQHFDLGQPDIRDKLTEFSEMRAVIANDLWDSNGAAHAQIIDQINGNEAAMRVGTLLLTASLSTAVNAVKGLSREELFECLISPSQNINTFAPALEALQCRAWYMHEPDGKLCFDRQENLTKMLHGFAEEAPDNLVEDLIRHRLREMFKPHRKAVYEEVLPLPRIDDIVDKIRKNRILLIVTPDAKMPPKEITKLFDGLVQKNNICVLSGGKTQMASVERAARHLYAAKKADTRIQKGHAQRDELERKSQTYEHEFTSTVLNLFDTVFFPIQRSGRSAELCQKPLDGTRDQSKAYNGEEQIEKTLARDPLKLYLDINANFNAIRDKAEELLWPEGCDETRWIDSNDRLAEQPGMPWLPPKGIEHIKSLACNQGLWEDMGNGYVSKRPPKKRTSAQLVQESDRDDDGFVSLRVLAQNAGPTPRIHYAEDGTVSTTSPILKDEVLRTKALRIAFLVVDPSKQNEPGDSQVWECPPVIRNNLHEKKGMRMVELIVVPGGAVRYSTDGSEPRNGMAYNEPFEIGDEETVVQVFTEAAGLDNKAEFKFPKRGQKGPQILDSEPAILISAKGPKALDSRIRTFSGLKAAQEKSVSFEHVTLNVGTGRNVASATFLDVRVSASYVEETLIHLLKQFDADTDVTMKFGKAHFQSGYDLRTFADACNIQIFAEEVKQ